MKGDTGAQPDPRAFVLVAVKEQLPGHTEHLQVLERELLNEADMLGNKTDMINPVPSFGTYTPKLG